MGPGQECRNWQVALDETTFELVMGNSSLDATLPKSLRMLRRPSRFTGVAVEEGPEAHGFLVMYRFGPGLHIAQTTSMIQFDPTCSMKL